MIEVLLYTDHLIRNVLVLSLVFIAIIVCITLFIVFYLIRRTGRSVYRRQLKAYYSEIISSICICETTDEISELISANASSIRASWRKNKQSRKVFIKEMLKVQENLSGQAVNNIIWTYEHLGLVDYTLAQLKSGKWHLKVAAIQQLAAFKQVKHITAIYRETNHKNHHIRNAAQIAIVQLTGFEGLRFLKVISQPISQWQQLLLLQQLNGEDIQSERLKQWINSMNDTVVEFILRLIEMFKLYDCQDIVYPLLEHHNKDVRLQVLKVIREIQDESTAYFLERSFNGRDLQEQEMILDILSIAGSEEQIPFLLSLLDSPHEIIQYKTLCCMKRIHPGSTEQTFNLLEQNPLFHHILPILKEQKYT